MRNTFLAALAALLLLPASSSADQVTFGSDLAGIPDVAPDGTHLADTLLFNTTPKNSHAAPASGQILGVRVKGRIEPKGAGKQDNNLFHTQVLRPNSDGTFFVDSSSQHLYFDVGGPIDQVQTFVPSTQCIKRGEYVDFNYIGGWDGDMLDGRGTQYQIYKSDPTSQMFWYEADNGTNNGTTFTPNRQMLGASPNTNNPQHGRPYARELMMQVVVGTGFDSSQLCEGGLQGYEYSGVEVQKTTFTVGDDGVAGARIGCLTGRGFCEGTARLEIDGAEIGRTSFKINRNITTNLDIPLTNDGARIVNTRALVDANVIVDSRDDIGQQKTTSGLAALKSARPTPGGFAGTTVRAQSAGVKKGVFFVKATCPLGTQGNCTGTMSISSQKRVVLRRGSRGKVYKFGSGKFAIEPGQSVRIQVKMSSAGKKVFKKVKSVVSIATVTTSDASGKSVSKRSKVTLKRR